MIRDEPGFILLKNESELERAALYNELPRYVQGIEGSDPAVTSRPAEIERTEAEQRSSSLFVADHASGPGVVFLAEADDPGWRASVGDRDLETIESVWGNAFEVPSNVEGELKIAYPRSGVHYFWLVVVPLMWIVALGGAFSRRKAPLSEEA